MVRLVCYLIRSTRCSQPPCPRKINCVKETHAGVGLPQFTFSFFHYDVTNIPRSSTSSLYKSTGYSYYVNLYENQTSLQLLVTTSDIPLITLAIGLPVETAGGQVVGQTDRQTVRSFHASIFETDYYRDCTEKLCTQYKSPVALGFK